MSQDEKDTTDHLHADQDEVAGTTEPPHEEQQKGTGEPGADIPDHGDETHPEKQD